MSGDFSPQNFSPGPAALARRLWRSSSVTPGCLDRFIPQRRSSDQHDAAFFNRNGLARSQSQCGSPGLQAGVSPAGTPVFRRSSSYSGDLSASEDKVLVFSQRPRLSTADSFDNFYSVFDDQYTSPLQRTRRRSLPRSPDRVLDLPDINDDICGQFMDWSSRDEIAVAQPGRTVYTWSAVEGRARALEPAEEEEGCNISSVAWDPSGLSLAIAEECGSIGLWDSTSGSRVTQFSQPHELDEHPGNESTHSLSWIASGNAFYSGHKCGCIARHDMRLKYSRTVLKSGDTMHICRLSPDGVYMAGGGDGVVHVWDLRTNKIHRTIDTQGLFVKALAWMPWHTRVFAAGGSEDGKVAVWNSNSGVELSSVQTKSELCSMVWSEETRELVTGHGTGSNAIHLWKYPHLTHVGSLTAHQARVLHLSISPDKKTLASCGSDESLMMWDCFRSSGKEKRKSHLDNIGSPRCASPLMRMMTIR